MKNKFRTIFLVVMIILNCHFTFADEFVFEVTDLEITEKGNIYRGNNRGKITTNNQLELISDNFEYIKKINRLEANGNVVFFDPINNVVIKAEKIFYLKNQEKIYTVGKTFIEVSNKYNFEGYNLTLLKNELIIFSKEQAIITDDDLNIYELDQFEYSINKEILKGVKIKVTTRNELNTDKSFFTIQNNDESKSDEYFFNTGFFNFKENKFIGKDIDAKLHKSLFGDNNNDPRINSVSGHGNKLNSFFKKAVFTSCKKTDKCPPWKIKSDIIHHDRVKKQIIYKDSWLEIYDIPVVYFPKFFHPDPSVKRQSGLLRPELGSHNTLGDYIYTPYFHVLSDDRDLTIKPRLFNDNKIVFQNEYRQLTNKSLIMSDFSITDGHDSSSLDKGDSRSHFFINSKTNLDLDKFTKSNLEINYEKTSNDNYLKLFNFLESPLMTNGKDVLETFVKLDLEHEDYDLETTFAVYETLSGAQSDRYQYILPSYNFSKNFFLDNLNGSFIFNTSGDNSLNNTNIMNTKISNNLIYESMDYFYTNGIKTNYEILLKNINTIGKDSNQYKSSPQSELANAYIYSASIPLIKETSVNLNTLEPTISFRLSPNDMKKNTSASRRIDANNVFNSNRLSLDDSFESGESLTLGLNFQKKKINLKNKNTPNEIKEIEDFFDLKLGTVFRLNEEQNIPTSSTLNKKSSNIFGKINFFPSEELKLGYSFSLKNNLNNFEYNSIYADFNFGKFSTQINFEEERGAVGKKNMITNESQYKIDEENSLIFRTRKDRLINLTEYYDLIYEYKNDCLIAGLKYKKTYYNDVDLKPIEELFFTITIVPITKFSPDKLMLSDYR
tara:strand:- start:1028 stop:3538 length:2511 start_codon:yes stop_codon:yes gene_type:complete